MLTFEAIPIEKYASKHKVPLLSLLNIKMHYSPQINVAFNFSLLPINQMLNSQLLFTARDTNNASTPVTSDFCIKNITRWRVNLSGYDSFTDYIQTHLNCRLQRKYEKTQSAFSDYGATFSLIEGDWSDYAEAVYHLYLNVAKKHKVLLYDLNYFRLIAKRKEYKLMCFWYNNSLFAALVMLDEEPILHSMLCCLDYNHSKLTHVYSKMHYEIIRLAIESKKHSIVDIGFTADKAKAVMGYHPVSSCIDISSQNRLIKFFLRFSSHFCTATITEESKLKLHFHL